MFTLSLLDQSPILPGDTASEAIQRTIKMAQFAEENGFKRFWVSEHHQAKDYAGSAPEILISHLLAKTNKIHIGSGGVMLSHYSPFKVAEVFHVLANIAPGRVDLGVGKAPGGLPLATQALQYNGLDHPVDFNTRLADLTSYMDGSNSLQVEPRIAITPELFVLGGSIESAEHAALLGISYVYAQFINRDESKLIDAARAYKKIHPNGNFAVCLSVVAADTNSDAQELVKNCAMYQVHFEDRHFSLTNEESAVAFGEQSNKPYTIRRVASAAIAGDVDTIMNKFEELTKIANVDEFILHNPILEEHARFHSIELISKYNLNYNNRGIFI